MTGAAQFTSKYVLGNCQYVIIFFLQSVTEDDTYTDFMNTAELAGREFDAEKWNVKLLDAQTRQVYIDTTEGDSKLKVARYSIPPAKDLVRYPLAREGVYSPGGRVCLAHA